MIVMRAILGVFGLAACLVGVSMFGAEEPSSGKETSKPARTFSAAEVYWDDQTRQHRDVILAGLAKVWAENDECATIDTGSVMLSTSKGSSEDPVFFVACSDERGRVFNAFFAKSAVEAGASLAAAKAVGGGQAIDLCADWARAEVTRPATFGYSAVFGTNVTRHAGGRATVVMSASTENAFGAKIDLGVRCVIEGASVIDGSVRQAR